MPTWNLLLNPARPHDKKAAEREPQRTDFQRDFDRIVFSSAFRRLQDKTQVHPLPGTDYVRRRLTHSLEVSCVARSLGTRIGQMIKERYPETAAEDQELASQVGQITASAALAHDIGNPPFGHVGEAAISSWFRENSSHPFISKLSSVQRSDIENFEGNAQGFRILSRTGNNGVGLKLTAATLGAFTKYPTPSDKTKVTKYIGQKKYGFFQADADLFTSVAKALDLNLVAGDTWQRHPLAFLVEAADDICYRIIDVEDGVKLRRISFRDAEDCFVNMLENKSEYKKQDEGDEANLGWLRAKAIDGLIKAVQTVFLDNERDILSGRFPSPLLDASPMAGAIEQAKNLVVKHVFNWDRTIKAEIAGTRMLSSLLGDFMQAASSPQSHLSQKVLSLINQYPHAASEYERILAITDYLSGMTDTFLVQTYRQVHGHTLN